MPRKKKPDAAYLRDMQTAAKLVVETASRVSFAEFQSNVVLRWAVERGVEIIGEAAYSISEDLKAANPDIPWTKIMRQRNRLAHDYDDIDEALIWRVATVHIPDLLSKLGPLVPPSPPEPGPHQL